MVGGRHSIGEGTTWGRSIVSVKSGSGNVQPEGHSEIVSLKTVRRQRLLSL